MLGTAAAPAARASTQRGRKLPAVGVTRCGSSYRAARPTPPPSLPLGTMSDDHLSRQEAARVKATCRRVRQRPCGRYGRAVTGCCAPPTVLPVCLPGCLQGSAQAAPGWAQRHGQHRHSAWQLPSAGRTARRRRPWLVTQYLYTYASCGTLCTVGSPLPSLAWDWSVG